MTAEVFGSAMKSMQLLDSWKRSLFLGSSRLRLRYYIYMVLGKNTHLPFRYLRMGMGEGGGLTFRLLPSDKVMEKTESRQSALVATSKYGILNLSEAPHGIPMWLLSVY